MRVDIPTCSLFFSCCLLTVNFFLCVLILLRYFSFTYLDFVTPPAGQVAPQHSLASRGCVRLVSHRGRGREGTGKDFS